MTDKVSVIIPTLDESKNIENCLNCLLNQTKKPLEIIVIDNGSADKTREIVVSLKRKFGKRGIALKLFYYSRGNQTNARDFGVRKARGEIMGSLDADALAQKDWVSKIEGYFKDAKIVGIGGKSKFRNRGKTFNLLYLWTYYFKLIFKLYCIGGNNSAFRKSAFLSVKGYNGLEKLRKTENILYAKDDYFLSKKLEQIGKINFCSDLNVTLLQRVRETKKESWKEKYSVGDTFNRIIREIIYDYKINKYFNEKKKLLKSD